MHFDGLLVALDSLRCVCARHCCVLTLPDAELTSSLPTRQCAGIAGFLRGCVQKVAPRYAMQWPADGTNVCVCVLFNVATTIESGTISESPPCLSLSAVAVHYEKA